MNFAANAIDARLNKKNPGVLGTPTVKFCRFDLRGVRQGVGNQERELTLGHTGICRILPEMRSSKELNSERSTCHSSVHFLGRVKDRRYFSLGNLSPDWMHS